MPEASAQEQKMGFSDQVTIKVTRGNTQNSTVTQSTNQTVTNLNVTSGSQSTGGTLNTGPHVSYNTSYQAIVADSSNSLTVQTDRHLYESAGVVKVQGTVWSGLVATVGGIDTVSVQARDNNDTVIYSGKSHLNSDGSYSTNLQLPQNVKNGWFTLETKADVSQDVLNTLTFKMQAGLNTITKFVVINPNSWPISINGMNFDVNIASNSVVNNVNFDAQSKKISFTVTGENGTEGVTDITIPKSLLSGTLTVMMDGEPIPQNDVVETDAQDSTTLEVNYHHSTHEIEIVGTNTVPEFPVTMMILGIALSSFLIFNLFVNRIKKL
jgi:hypothetical protein